MLHRAPTTLTDYLHHCGVGIGELGEAVESGWPAIETLILAHYREKPGVYSIKRVAADLANYPPMLARIAEIQRALFHKEAEKKERREKAKNARKARQRTRR